MDHRLCLALIAGLSLGGCVVEEDPELGSLDQEVIGGGNEPNFRYPWQVHVSGALECGGVLIDRRWVLTAAHCVSELTPATVSYSRTDPYTGVVYSDESDGEAFPHPNWGTQDDIALIRLDSPFTLDRYIQTVALPTGAVAVGAIGTVANPERDAGEGPPPPGTTAIYRAPVVPGVECAAASREFCAQVDGAALCAGDSGSGFVTYPGATLTSSGRATAHGIASSVNDAQCEADDYGQNVRTTEVADHRTWIAETTGISLSSFAGDARLRWDGQPSRGMLTLRCENTWGAVKTTVSPMNVAGIEARLDCPVNTRVRATCNLGGDPNARITGFKVTTTPAAGGTPSVVYPTYSAGSATWVSGYGVNIDIREIACKVSPVNVLN